MLWTAVCTAAAHTLECTVAHVMRKDPGAVGVTEFARPPSLRDRQQ